MKKLFCDFCGEEVKLSNRPSTNGKVVSKSAREKPHKSVEVALNVRLASDTDICIACLMDVLKKFDTRPEHAPMVTDGANGIPLKPSNSEVM